MGMGKLARVTTPQLRELPRVSADGIYQPNTPGTSAGVNEVLAGRLVPFMVAPVPATPIFIDSNAARRYGLGDLLSKGPFPVDQNFFNALTSQFALRNVPENAAGTANTEELQCSRYAQSERNKGDGRGGYIVRTNPDGTTSTLFVKGVGQTPLCDVVNGEAGHTNGYVGSHSALAESVWPTVFQNLFTHSTPGTIAFFGLEHFGVLDHRLPVEQAVILLRGGQMLRPAHHIEQAVYEAYGAAAGAMKAAYPHDLPGNPLRVLSQSIPLDPSMGGTVSPDTFFKSAQATGVLRYHTVPGHGEQPDLRATFATIIDNFALTAAESWAWRWMQSAPSAGNAELSGGLIDVETASTNSRTAPMYVLSYTHPFGHAEFTWRVVGIKMMWDSLSLNLTAEQRVLYNMGKMDFAQLHADSYNTHLSTQYLKATGLKDAVVQSLVERFPDDVANLKLNLHELATMENPGPIPVVMNREGHIAEDAEAMVTSKAVVDVFGFLGKWSEIYFNAAAKGQKPTLEQAVAALDPIWSDNPQHRRDQEADVRQFAHEVVKLHDRLMQRAVREGVGHYDTHQAMREDVVARAAFRNQPMPELYYWNMRREILDDVARIDPGTGRTVLADMDYLQPAVHGRVERSVRNIDHLLRDRDVAVRTDGQVNVGVTMYGNTTYGVRADPVSGARQLFMQIPVGHEGGAYELNLIGRSQSLASVDGAKILYKMTEKGAVVAQGEAVAQQITAGGHVYLGFEVPLKASQYGVFAATLDIPGVVQKPLLEYAYVSPDNATVRKLARSAP